MRRLIERCLRWLLGPWRLRRYEHIRRLRRDNRALAARFYAVATVAAQRKTMLDALTEAARTGSWTTPPDLLSRFLENHEDATADDGRAA